jgi:hypothetical protein
MQLSPSYSDWPSGPNVLTAEQARVVQRACYLGAATRLLSQDDPRTVWQCALLAARVVHGGVQHTRCTVLVDQRAPLDYRAWGCLGSWAARIGADMQAWLLDLSALESSANCSRAQAGLADAARTCPVQVATDAHLSSAADTAGALTPFEDYACDRMLAFVAANGAAAVPADADMQIDSYLAGMGASPLGPVPWLDAWRGGWIPPGLLAWSWDKVQADRSEMVFYGPPPGARPPAPQRPPLDPVGTPAAPAEGGGAAWVAWAIVGATALGIFYFTLHMPERNPLPITRVKAATIARALRAYGRVNLEEFRKGLEVEQEHRSLTGGDLMVAGQIALDHLRELPDYYTRLAKMEAGE